MRITLALELAAPFLCPRIGALAATCKELRTASLSTITWTPFFRRRYPCLAAVEHFAAPADARALVKGLLHAAPPPQRWELPACPRDASGRALPLRGEVILAVQLSVRGTGCAFAHGTRRLTGLDLHPSTPFRSRRRMPQGLDVRVSNGPHRSRRARCGPGLAAALSLPQIAISPEHFLATGTPNADHVPVWGEPDEVIHRLLETFCRQADANLLPEIYVVAGDDIWLLSRRRRKSSTRRSFDYYNDHFKQPFRFWHFGRLYAESR